MAPNPSPGCFVTFCPAASNASIKEWVALNIEKIELFFLPSYSPKLNPDEYLNCDLKNRIADKRQSRDKEGLELKVQNIMSDLDSNPTHIQSYFRHPRIKYAA